MQATAIGRCAAAQSAARSGDACCEKAVANPSRGIQMNPCASGASCGACGCGLPAIEHVGDRLTFVGCQCGYEDQRPDPLVGGRAITAPA